MQRRAFWVDRKAVVNPSYRTIATNSALHYSIRFRGIEMLLEPAPVLHILDLALGVRFGINVFRCKQFARLGKGKCDLVEECYDSPVRQFSRNRNQDCAGWKIQQD